MDEKKSFWKKAEDNLWYQVVIFILSMAVLFLLYTTAMKAVKESRLENSRIPGTEAVYPGEGQTGYE